MKILTRRREKHWVSTITRTYDLIQKALGALEEDGEDGIHVARSALYEASTTLSQLP